MQAEGNAMSIRYEGFTPDEKTKSSVQQEFERILEASPYDSSIETDIMEIKGKFSVEAAVRHVLGEFRAFAEEATLSEAMSNVVLSLSYQVEQWRESRFREGKVISEDPQSNLRVLLVDDDPISVKLLESCFKQQGCSTEVVNDGERAIEVLDHNDYDLVVLDWNMPNLNGQQTLKKLDRKMKKTDARVPILTYSIYDKGKIQFPRSDRVFQLGHIPKSAPYRLLRGYTKSYLFQLKNQPI